MEQISNNGVIINVMTPEEVQQRESILKNRLLAGEQLDFVDCNSLLDTTDDIEIWKAICINHIQKPVDPPVDIIENYDTDRGIEFEDMIYRVLDLCVSRDNGWGVELPFEFIRNLILFSTNEDALYVIADYPEEKIHNPNYDNKPDLDMLRNIKKLAYNRYNYLISRGK